MENVFILREGRAGRGLIPSPYYLCIILISLVTSLPTTPAHLSPSEYVFYGEYGHMYSMQMFCTYKRKTVDGDVDGQE